MITAISGLALIGQYPSAQVSTEDLGRFQTALETYKSKHGLIDGQNDEDLLTSGIYVANKILSAKGEYALRYISKDHKPIAIGFESSPRTKPIYVNVVLVSKSEGANSELQFASLDGIPTVLARDSLLRWRVFESSVLRKASDPSMAQGLVAFKLLHELGHYATNASPGKRNDAERRITGWVKSNALPTRLSGLTSQEELRADAFAIGCVSESISASRKIKAGDRALSPYLSLHMLDGLRNVLEDNRLARSPKRKQSVTPNAMYLPTELRVNLACYSLNPVKENLDRLKSYFAFLESGKRPFRIIVGGPLPKGSSPSTSFDWYFGNGKIGASTVETRIAQVGKEQVLITEMSDDVNLFGLKVRDHVIVESTIDGRVTAMSFDTIRNRKRRKVEMRIQDREAVVRINDENEKVSYKYLKVPPKLLPVDLRPSSILESDDEGFFQFSPDSASFVKFSFVDLGTRTALFNGKKVVQRSIQARSANLSIIVYLSTDNFAYEISQDGLIRLINRESGMPDSVIK